MKRIFNLAVILGLTVLSLDCRSQLPPVTTVSGVNLTSNLQANAFDPANPYQESDILATSFQVGALTNNYQLLIQGVAYVQNSGAQMAKIDILITSSLPLCGSPHGTAPFGRGRVLTVTVPPGRTVAVPVSVFDFVSMGSTSSARLQFRHATAPLTVIKNSYLDVTIIPASDHGPTASPSEGLPVQPDNCP